MGSKIIAIGNILMGNDGIGIKVLERIDSSIKANGVETYIGETDFQYCLSIINEGDYIIILDAAISGRRCGELTIMPIEKQATAIKGVDQHMLSLIDFIHFYYKDIKGYIIGIEVENIVYSIDISSGLKERFDEICINVLDMIIKIKDEMI